MDRETLIKELKKVLNSGKVLFGVKQAKKALNKGDAKLVIVANNCPERNEIQEWNVAKIFFDGDSVELGASCGKPFSISVLTIIDEGESNLLKMVKI